MMPIALPSANKSIGYVADDTDEVEDRGPEGTLALDEVASLKEKGVIYGPENAKITILEFADASCGYCKRQI